MAVWNHRHENNVKHWGSMKQSSAWKDLERLAAKELRGDRVCRAGNFAISATDVVVPDFLELKVDTKRRKRKFAHHSMLSEIREKYCYSEGDVAVLVTRNHGERGAVASMSLRDLGELLDRIRTYRSRDGIDNEGMVTLCSDRQRS